MNNYSLIYYIPNQNRSNQSEGISHFTRKKAFYRFFEIISDPGIMVICDSPNEVSLNKSIIRMLDYASIMELKQHISDISKIIAPSQITILKKAAWQNISRSGVKFRDLTLIRKDGSTIHCKTKVFSFCFAEDEMIILCVIEKIIDWSKFRIDNAFNYILKHRDILDKTELTLDFNENILRIKNKSKKFDFKATSKWRRTNLFDLIVESDSEKLRIRLGQLKNGMKLSHAEYKLAIPVDKPCYIQAYSKRAIYRNKKVIISTIKDISNKKEAQNELLKAIMNTEENERSRFSSDLHDQLGPFLSALKLSVQSLANQHVHSKQKELLKSMGNIIEDAICNMRSLARNLSPRNISVQGISATINDLVFRLNQSGRIQIVYVKTGIDKEYDLAFATSIYRIVLEIINNGIKHANARLLHIKLSYGSDYVNIHYEDDGRGFDFENLLKYTKGIGLRSIINRIKHYKGSYEFSKREPNGTVIKISLPVNI
jgi:signal transduction histidine kinase